MAMWRTVIRSGQVVPAMKAMVPAKAILNKNPAGWIAFFVWPAGWPTAVHKSVQQHIC